MRYTEPKARSAELLRLALARMGQHEASFNPLTFTLWYEYVSGINPKLNTVLDQMVQHAQPVDDEAVLRLYKEQVAPADEKTMERISGEMQRLIQSVAQSATRTGDRAGAYREQLSGLTEALASQSVEQLTPRLTEVLAGTAEMKESVDALQQRVASSQNEIHRLRSDLERARGEALLDPLTGIMNRKGFDQRLAAVLAQVPAPGACHCLVMLDIDHFKRVNDTHGHLMGDRVIQAMGEILRTSVSDVAHSVARYGGEEFAILLPDTSLDESTALAETVRHRTKAMKIRDRQTHEVVLTVTISGGVAAMKQGDDAASLISRADEALYASKKGGRDRVTRG